MHINGIIITKQFISHWNSKWLRGSIGRTHIHIGYIFLKSNEEIVVRNPKSKIFIIIIIIIIISALSCLCVILQFVIFAFVKVARLHTVALWLPRREDHLLRLSFDAR